MIKSKSIRTILFLILSLLVSFSVFYGVIFTNNPITIIVDGMEIRSYASRGETVGEVLDKNDIDIHKDGKVYPSKDSSVGRSGTIVLENPVPVIIYLGKMEPYEVMTTSKTVLDLIREQGIEVKDSDFIEPSLETHIVPDMEVKIKFVDSKIQQEQHEVPYEVKIVYNHEVYEGIETVKQEGKNGLRVVKREIKFENSIEVSNIVVYDNVDVAPIDKIVEVGTKKKQTVHVESSNAKETMNNAYNNGNKINFLGKEYRIKETRLVESTAFYDSGTNGNHITATGNPTVYNPSGWGTIAVDPRYIPLNTKVYVEGYGFAHAHDTGGAIKGNIIDVFMPNRTTTYNWGRKYDVKIYILE